MILKFGDTPYVDIFIRALLTFLKRKLQTTIYPRKYYVELNLFCWSIFPDHWLIFDSAKGVFSASLQFSLYDVDVQ